MYQLNAYNNMVLFLLAPDLDGSKLTVGDSAVGKVNILIFGLNFRYLSCICT